MCNLGSETRLTVALLGGHRQTPWHQETFRINQAMRRGKLSMRGRRLGASSGIVKGVVSARG